MTTRTPAKFYTALAVGAPKPFREPPIALERMIHFVPPHLDKVMSKIGETMQQVDVVLGNLEDGVPIEDKEKARRNLIAMGKAHDWSKTGLWARINASDTQWMLDDVMEIVSEIGDVIDVIMVPKVNGPWDIHYVDQLLAQLEARHKVSRPIRLHAIIETAEGVNNIVEIAGASPRMHGLSLGPADLAANRGMKTTRVGGGHPNYGVLGDKREDGPRTFHQQDMWAYTLSRIVDACIAYQLKPFYGPFGDFEDPDACESQFRDAFILGCAGTWTLHPSQIAIAAKVFTPTAGEVAFARKIVAALPTGSGAVMVEGKMQDDATWKQANVLLDLAQRVAEKDPEAGKNFGM